jgi:hypothetical protein
MRPRYRGCRSRSSDLPNHLRAMHAQNDGLRLTRLRPAASLKLSVDPTGTLDSKITGTPTAGLITS